MWMTNKDGLALKTYVWPATNEKATVLFVHGHGSYALYIESWIPSLNGAGITVRALDLHGHGHSEDKRGLRCFVESFDDYVDDVLRVAREAPKPLFLLGHSMGGCVSLHAAMKSAMFDGVILLAPMISLEKVSKKGLNPYIRPLSALLSIVCPSASIVAASSSRDTERHPLGYYEKTRIRNAVEYLRATEKLRRQMKDIDVPMLTFHSRNDAMTDADGSVELYIEARSFDKDLYFIDDFGHDIVREDDNEHVLKAIIEWILKRTDAHEEPWTRTTIKRLYAMIRS